MNIEELFDNEIYHSYGMLTTDDANCLINYLKEEVMEYVAGLQKQIERIAELECAVKTYESTVELKDKLIDRLYANIAKKANRIAELEA